MMLRNWRDCQSVAYLLALPLLVYALWHGDWSEPKQSLYYAALVFFYLALGVINHNHAHYRLWKNKYLNRASDVFIALLQGHPTFVFFASHNANHHRYHHGALDIARTYRFYGGDSNHLLGYLSHPFFAVWVLYPVFLQWLLRIKKRAVKVFWYFLSQYFFVGFSWALLAWIDPFKFLIYVLLPQLFGLHWLLASNYLQHAHADGNSSINFARNFSGWCNFLLFNIGHHTAHHLHPRAHWTELPRLNYSYQSMLNPSLYACSLSGYILRTLIISVVWKPWRSQSLMTHIKTPTPTQASEQVACETKDS
jgi:fatty acid desaturase